MAPTTNKIADCALNSVARSSAFAAATWTSASAFGPNQTAARPPATPKIHHGKTSRRCSWAFPTTAVLKSKTAREGVMVTALTAEMTVETEIVSANWRKKWPVMPPMNAQGTNTAHSTRATATIGPVTSSMALIVAVRGS